MDAESREKTHSRTLTMNILHGTRIRLLAPPFCALPRTSATPDNACPSLFSHLPRHRHLLLLWRRDTAPGVAGRDRRTSGGSYRDLWRSWRTPHTSAEPAHATMSHTLGRRALLETRGKARMGALRSGNVGRLHFCRLGGVRRRALLQQWHCQHSARLCACDSQIFAYAVGISLPVLFLALR